jgi:uncharacterized protein YjbJ (UPF0337 family)
MNWDRVEKKWKQQVEKTVNRWKNMMNNELAAIVGKYEQFVEILQNKCSVAKEGAKRQVDAFKDIIEQLKNLVGS